MKINEDKFTENLIDNEATLWYTNSLLLKIAIYSGFTH